MGRPGPPPCSRPANSSKCAGSSCVDGAGGYDGLFTGHRVSMRLQGGSAMNATLNLVDQLLAMGRKYQELGRHRDALTLFTRLAGFRELPPGAAEETQARLAELQL